MKSKITPLIKMNLNSNITKQTSNSKVVITNQELIIFNKIGKEKEIEYFNSVTPYALFFISSLGIIFVTLVIIKRNIHMDKQTFRKFYLNLLDLEEVEQTKILENENNIQIIDNSNILNININKNNKI